jgi:putative ABC transport system permease protein
MIRHAFYLATRYLAAAPGRTLVLILGTAVALFLPAFTRVASGELRAALLSRAESSPVLVGHVGNPFDLTLNALYFSGAVRDPLAYGDRKPLQEKGYGEIVPLYILHSVGGSPLVATELNYYPARGLTPVEGRLPAVLGEVVAGAEVAQEFNLQVGDTLRSDTRNLYNIAGSYPLLLQVTGILGPSNTPDDTAFFCDLRTAWALDGALHGHQAVTADLALNPEAAADEALTATAAIFMFQEIDESNRASFHMHGDADAQPISSLLVLPDSPKHHDQLLGDLALEETRQAVRPARVIDTILGIVLRIESGLKVYFSAVAFSTAAFFLLVISLTLRLRETELTLMRRIGCSPFTIATMVGGEISLILSAAAGLAALGTWACVLILRAGIT